MVVNKHGSFYMRSGWGTKIIQAVKEDNMIFSPSNEQACFYNSIIEAITSATDNYIGYDEKIFRSRGVQARYIDMLNEIGNIYGEIILDELERYRGTFEEVEEQGFAEILGE